MKNLILGLLVVLVANALAGQTLYSWGTADPATVSTNMSANNPSRANALTLATGCTSFHSMNCSTATTYSSSLSAVEISMVADAGYQLNVTNFSCDLRRSSTGPTKVRFAYSVDGVNWTDSGVDVAPGGTTCTVYATRTWDVPDFATVSTLYVRLYCFSAGSATQTFTIQNFVVNGTVSSAAGFNRARCAHFLMF